VLVPHDRPLAGTAAPRAPGRPRELPGGFALRRGAHRRR
jgi:hypothetical protein